MRTILVFAMATSAFTVAATAQETPSDTLLTVGHFLDLERVGGAQLSPDGSQIVYTRSRINQMEDRWDSDLWIMNADGSRNRYLTEGSSPQWSPDGTRIAYMAPGDPKGAQVYVRWMDAEGATSQITRVTETPGSIQWSPDGTRISFVMLVPHAETWNIDMPSAPRGANWTKPPRMVSRTHYRQDRRGFMEEGFTHLFVVPADGGTPRALTSGEWNVGARFSGLSFGAGYDWTPDGSAIVFDGVVADSGEAPFRESYIYAVNVRSGDITRLVEERGYWSGPEVSPDGRRVAFSGYPFTLQTYTASDLYTVNIDGTGLTKASGDFDRDIGTRMWRPDGRGIYFTAGNHGSQNVYLARNGQVEPVTTGTHMLSITSMNDRGLTVGTLTSPHQSGDIVSVDLRRNGTISQLTRVNDDVLGDIRLGAVEEIWYTSGTDVRVQGWIVKPPDFDPAGEYPLILHIHGGPHAMYNVGFNYSFQNYAANGYVVLYTNPRGSTGYGTAFGNAIDNGYPSVDHDDLMVGVDSVVGRGYVDTDRMYVTGCSGGGVLSSWAIGHTDRFAAAAVRCPVVNWISFAGTADIVEWAYNRFRGYYWDDPTEWLDHSPIMHVGNVNTPTLLMTGELDLRTPMSQTEEFYAALKVRGIPAVLLRFNDEYHGTGSKPSNYMRTQLYIMDWFGKWPEPAPSVSDRE